MKTIQEKETQFRALVASEANDEFKPYIEEFCDYWTEPNMKATKLRHENEKFFHVNRRLATWKKRAQERFNGARNTEVRAEVIKPTGKVMEIENELIVAAWNHFSLMATLDLKHDECFDFLKERGVFKTRKTAGDKWPSWEKRYAAMAEKAKVYACAYAKKNAMAGAVKNIKEGNHPILERFAKLECLKGYFSQFKTEDQLKKKLQ